jgi:hypothetical protein
MKTQHIFGMAKSCLNVKGAKLQKIELDFLRLLYFVEKFEVQGDSAVGYLLVYDEAIKKTVKNWFIDKYKNDGDKIIVKTISEVKPIWETKESDINLLESEKQRNSEANTSHIKLQPKEKASGEFGKVLFEEALSEYLINEYKIKESNFSKKQFGIDWDFYHKI